MPAPKPTLKRLAEASAMARQVQAEADARLAKRDEMAADLADQGVKYADLAQAMGITPDGVTYVLRKVRQRRAQK